MWQLSQTLQTRPASSSRDNHQVYTELHENLILISQLYPPSLIKPHSPQLSLYETTFVRPNKAAFQDTLYYLLHCIDPDLTKTSLPSWPVCESNIEPQFRSELTAYLTKMNDAYLGADIPIYQSSHFVSPGGYKIAYLLFKLSQLAMVQLLQSNGVKELVLPGKHDQEMSEGLQAITASIESEIWKELGKFTEWQEEFLSKSRLVLEKLEWVRQEVATAQKVLDRKMAAAVHKVPEGELERARKQVQQVVEVDKEFTEMQGLIACLKGLVLEHAEPQELSLNRHFDEVNGLLRKYAHKLVCPSSEFLLEVKPKLDAFINRYKTLISKLQVQEAQLLDVNSSITTLISSEFREGKQLNDGNICSH